MPMDESHAIGARDIQQQDPTAIAQLLAKHYSLIFNRCLRVLGHREDAEDVTQETFSRAFKYIHRWDPRRPLEPWLMTIAGNRCRTHLSKRRYSVSLSDTENLDEAEQAATHAKKNLRAESEGVLSLREEVDLAISHLPTNHRLAFELFHSEGLEYVQIAERLSCPLGTAKTWVHRARNSLMSELRQRELAESRKPSVTQATSQTQSSMRSPRRGAAR